ncbi:unnamed protein product, partial [marine sediment metagenome]
VNKRKFLDALNRRVEGLKYARRPIKEALELQQSRIIRGTYFGQREIKSKGGRVFKALSPKYAKQKARMFPGEPIMARTRKMLDPSSFIIKVTRAIAATTGWLRYVGPKYGLCHQEKKSKGKVRRAWFGFRRGDVRAMMPIFQKFILRVIAGARL